MSAEDRATGQAIEVTVERPLTDKETRFAARLALGDSVRGASAHVGIGKTLGYEWEKREVIQKEIARYAGIAATNARRMIVGAVRGAVRTVRKLSQSAESEAVRFQAAKYLLDVVKIGEMPVGQTRERIVSRIPRDYLPEEDSTLDTLEAQYQASDLPRIATPDRLPPDFPRPTPEQADAEYDRKSRYE